MLASITSILIVAVVVGGGTASLTYNAVSFFDLPFWPVYVMGGIGGIVGACSW